MSTTTAAIYDDTLNDDCAHDDVVAAREAGRAWADREYDAALDPPSGGWLPSDNDALPLVTFGPTSDVDQQWERERELAAICNAAAAERWNVLVAEAE